MHGDSRELLKEIPDKTAQMVWTDMPYPSMETHRSVGTTTRLKEWFDVISYNDILPIATELYRILDDNTHAYFMTDFASLPTMKTQIEKTGFECRQLIVWDKNVRTLGYHWVNQCEYILFFEKGERKLNKKYTNLLRYTAIRGGCPAEKPRQLYSMAIKNSTNEGELVIDPFMGASGNIIRECTSLNRRYIGIEKNDEYFTRCQRVEQRSCRA